MPTPNQPNNPQQPANQPAKANQQVVRQDQLATRDLADYARLTGNAVIVSDLQGADSSQQSPQSGPGAVAAVVPSTVATADINQPVPTPLNLQSQVNLVGAQLSGVQQVVSTQLGQKTQLIGVPLANCHNAIAAYLQTRLKSLIESCQGSYDCLRQQLANLQAMAAEAAAQGGCDLTLAKEVAASAVNALRAGGPYSLATWAANPAPVVSGADLATASIQSNPAWFPSSQPISPTAPPQQLPAVQSSPDQSQQ